MPTTKLDYLTNTIREAYKKANNIKDDKSIIVDTNDFLKNPKFKAVRAKLEKLFKGNLKYVIRMLDQLDTIEQYRSEKTGKLRPGLYVGFEEDGKINLDKAQKQTRIPILQSLSSFPSEIENEEIPKEIVHSDDIKIWEELQKSKSEEVEQIRKYFSTTEEEIKKLYLEAGDFISIKSQSNPNSNNKTVLKFEKIANGILYASGLKIPMAQIAQLRRGGSSIEFDPKEHLMANRSWTNFNVGNSSLSFELSSKGLRVLKPFLKHLAKVPFSNELKEEFKKLKYDHKNYIYRIELERDDTDDAKITLLQIKKDKDKVEGKQDKFLLSNKGKLNSPFAVKNPLKFKFSKEAFRGSSKPYRTDILAGEEKFFQNFLADAIKHVIKNRDS